MLFSDELFIFFFSATLAVYFLLRNAVIAQRLWITVASLAFYGFFDVRYVVLLLGVSIANWCCVLMMRRGPTIHRVAFIASICMSLLTLGIFKYLNLFIDTVNSVAEATNGAHVFSSIDIILPVGISFYIFQSMSYVIDVHRGRVDRDGSFLDFLFFVCFFPQLVAGPIVRAESFLPQIGSKRGLSISDIHWAITFFIIGLFQKIVLADGIFAPTANSFFADPSAGDTTSAWIGVAAFTGQIYCDFAGYSSCAIGVSLMFGYKIPLNFRLPYGAIGFSDFWNRWHISLSTWLRDYLYIPLGGNRKGSLITYRNLFITMLLGGLWHGAAWTFVAWGALHGAYLVLNRKLVPIWTALTGTTPETRMNAALGWILTLVCVMIGWVFFRADDIGTALEVLRSMSNLAAIDLSQIKNSDTILVTVCFLCLLAFSVVYRRREFFEYWISYPALLRGALIGAMLFAILTWRSEGHEFIYFRF